MNTFSDCSFRACSYFGISENRVAQTVAVSDVIAVDLDPVGGLVGVDFAVPVADVSREEWDALYARHPQLVGSDIEDARPIGFSVPTLGEGFTFVNLRLEETP